MEQENFETLLKRALQLAYFLHGDRTVAVEIAASAVKKLEVAAQAQDKRLYYTPGGRDAGRGARTKVTLGEPHLLQRLIYIESEPYERESVKNGPTSEDDMITYFIKHLVKLTLKRNSFYVALGVSRLLHKYSTAETMEIYNLAVQNPDRVRDDYYYRSRKARLMAEMKERFGDAVRAVRLNRGEERFESQAMCGQYAPLVLECLAQFTPWKSPCVVPESFDPGRQIVTELLYDSKDPDGEHVIEVNRIHSLIHPDCYLRIVNALKYDAPCDRLDIPRFFLAENTRRPPRDRGPSDWGKDEMAAVRRRLDEESERRKSFSAGLLRILVDGVERARIDVTRAAEAEFEIDSGAELLEVVGKDRRGEMVLATRLLDDRTLQQGDAKIRLEGGQEVRFTLIPAFDSLNEVESAAVRVAYRETRPLGAASLALRRLAARAGDSLGGGAGWLKPALAFVGLALLSAGLWFFVLRGDSSPEPPQLVEETPNPAPIPQEPQMDTPRETPPEKEVTSKKQIAADREQRSKRPKVQNGHRNLEPGPSEFGAESETRGMAARVTGVRLSEVKTIAIEIQGDGESGRQLEERLQAALASTTRFVVGSRETCDAVLKVTVKSESSGPAAVVRMSNRSGYVIFPGGRETPGRKYSGTPEEIAAGILNDLLTAIKK